MFLKQHFTLMFVTATCFLVLGHFYTTTSCLDAVIRLWLQLSLVQVRIMFRCLGKPV